MDVGGTTVNTLTVGDRLVGGDGIDVLDATLIGDATGFSLTGIEKVYFSPVNATGVTVSSTLSGVQEVWMKDALGDLTVNTVASALTVGVQNSEAVAFNVAYAGTVAAQTLVLDGAASVTVDVSMNGLENLTVNAQGVASSDVKLAGDLTDATSLTINAAAGVAFATAAFADVAALTVSGASDVDVSLLSIGASVTDAITVDATGASAGLALAIANTGAAALTATFGAGADELDISANTDAAAVVTVDMGAGDDTVIVDLGLIGQTDVSLVGGTGADTLSIEGVSAATDLEIDFTGVSGFEALSFADTVAVDAAATLDVTDLGINTITFEAAAGFTGTAGALEITGLGNNATVDFAAGFGEATATDVVDLTIDNGGSLTLSFGADSAVAGTEVNAFTFANATSLVFNVADASTDGTGTVDVSLALTELSASKATSITVTGGVGENDTFELDLSALTAGTGATDSNLAALNTVDFSGFNGTVDINLETAVIANKLTIKLSDGAAMGTVSTSTFATVELSDKADTLVFASDLLGVAEVFNFTAGLGGDVLNVAALGANSIADLRIVYGSGTATATITSTSASDLFDGSIEVTFVGSATTFTSDNFIFA